jgi:hypothetical protein
MRASVFPQNHSSRNEQPDALELDRQTCARRLRYVGYASASLPENLSPQDRYMKCSAFAVTLAGVLAFDHLAAW